MHQSTVTGPGLKTEANTHILHYCARLSAVDVCPAAVVHMQNMQAPSSSSGAVSICHRSCQHPVLLVCPVTSVCAGSTRLQGHTGPTALTPAQTSDRDIEDSTADKSIILALTVAPTTTHSTLGQTLLVLLAGQVAPTLLHFCVHTLLHFLVRHVSAAP